MFKRNLASLLAAMAITASCNAYASDDNTNTSPMCSAQYEMAQSSMSARQKGVPRGDINAIVSTDEGTRIVEQAYRVSIDKRDRENIIKYFSEYIRDECVREEKIVKRGTAL